MKAKHAVLCQVDSRTYLAYLKDDGEHYGFRQVEMPATFEGLMELAIAQDFDHYWIHASTGIVPNVAWSKYDKAAYDIFPSMTTDDRHGLMRTAHGWKLPAGGAKAVDIIFPHHAGWAKAQGKPAWGTLAGPRQLLMTIAYLEEALGITIASSPSSTGWDLAKKLHKGHIENISQRRLADMHFTRTAHFDLVDSRIPSKEELSRRFIIKLDKASAYLAACASEFYGVGTPVQTRQYDPKAVGVWNVSVQTFADGPFPIVTRKEPRWLAAPIVRLMQSQGYELEIHDGFIFPEKHQFLKNWANKIYDARQSLKLDKTRWTHENARQMAYESIKQIAVQTIGVTGYGGFDKDETSDKERPDIKGQTVARNFEIMYHNILKGQQDDNITPFLVNNDCVYLLVDNIDPCVSAPSYVMRDGKLRTGKPGCYKREGWMEVTAEIRDILTSNASTGKKKQALDAKGWNN